MVLLVFYEVSIKRIYFKLTQIDVKLTLVKYYFLLFLIYNSGATNFKRFSKKVKNRGYFGISLTVFTAFMLYFCAIKILMDL